MKESSVSIRKSPIPLDLIKRAFMEDHNMKKKNGENCSP
jgi:hypothetical protein